MYTVALQTPKKTTMQCQNKQSTKRINHLIRHILSVPQKAQWTQIIPTLKNNKVCHGINHTFLGPIYTISQCTVANGNILLVASRYSIKSTWQPSNVQWQICHYSTKEIREGTLYINGPVSHFHDKQSIAGMLNQPITPIGPNLIYKYHAGATVRINHDGEIVSKNHSNHTNGFLWHGVFSLYDCHSRLIMANKNESHKTFEVWTHKLIQEIQECPNIGHICKTISTARKLTERHYHW